MKLTKIERNAMTKPILFFDMDNVLVDFQSGIDRLDEATKHAESSSSERRGGGNGTCDSSQLFF